jgi:carbonic anhydrase/acetyltransferase-like protein (isoleucine patch superfamily)
VSERTAHWKARLALHPTAFIAPGAVVVGEVSLGARSSVWFNSVLRGDTDRIEVGDDSNIQDNSTVHMDEGYPALIGHRVTVGHRAIIHGCVIEDECLIGMGAVVLSGARIGTGSLIGAGAVVREGQHIPPGSLALGLPARVIGQVTDAHRAAIREGSEHYVALSREYLARGFARPHPAPHSDHGSTSRARGEMSRLEWERLLEVFGESPRRLAERARGAHPDAWRKPPPGGGWCALEVLAHLRDADVEVYLPRLEALLRESGATAVDIDMRDWPEARRYREQDPQAVMQSWRHARAQLVERLKPLGPRDWDRMVFHSRRGPMPLDEMLRGWVEHDLSHRRQFAAALGGGLA